MFVYGNFGDNIVTSTSEEAVRIEAQDKERQRRFVLQESRDYLASGNSPSTAIRFEVN